jgi:glycosyltransferase involved in cell wall biosynthesis
MVGKNELVKVSIIVTTKNEEKNIANCLESIKKQTYPQEFIEIIVVDNQSTDKTKEIARNFTNLVFEKGPERSAQRNFGVDQSSGDYVMYLDADMILSENVIKAAVNKVLNDSEIVALYISEIVMGEKFFSKVRRFERSFYDGTVVDCVRFIKKDIFKKVGGFDSTMTGPEDWDLDQKIRRAGKVALIKNPIYHNEAEFDLGKYLSKKGYYAQSFDCYTQKWGKDNEDVKKQLGFSYRFFKVFIENGKWKKMLKSPLLTLGMYFLRFLVGVRFLLRRKN